MRISIVTPCFNHVKFVERTLRSVLLQTGVEIEYIVMDGGSTDGSREVIEAYRQRLSYFVSAPDGGQSSAVREGLARATGEILCYLNSDDLLAPGALQFVADYFRRHPKVDALYSHRLVIDAEDRRLRYWILPPHSNYLMEHWDLIPQETTFWRRSLYETVGGIDDSFKFAFDYDLFVRFMRKGRLQRVNRFLGAFREHAASKTMSQLQEVGVPEIQRIWSQYDIQPPPFGQRIPDLFLASTLWRGQRQEKRRRPIPGALPRGGQDYGAIWQGALTASDVNR